MKKRFEKLFSPAVIDSAIIFVLSMIFMLVLAISVTNFDGDKTSLCIWIIAFYVGLTSFSLFLRYFASKKIAAKRGGEIQPHLGNMTLDLMLKMDSPVIISDMYGKIIWFNHSFSILCGTKTGYFGKNISSFCGSTAEEILDSGFDGIELFSFGKPFKVKGYIVSAPSKEYCITVWENEEELLNTKTKLSDKNSVVCYIVIDNLDELLTHVQDKYREVTNEIADIISKWAADTHGIAKEFQRNKYLFVFEYSELEKMIADNFSLLEKVKNVRVGNMNLPITLSLGISSFGDTMEEKEKNAQAALDMALQRGGDQAIIKEKEGLKYFGGRTQGTHKRTKVRSRVTASELISHISESGNVIIMGHVNPDYDSFGSCIGIARMCLFCGVNVKIVIDKKDRNVAKCFDYIYTLPEYSHIFVDAQDAQDLVNHDTLLVICDVNNKNQFQAPELATIIDRVVYIDHHRKTAEFDVKPLISYIDPSASSASELVTELLEQTIPQNKLPVEEANLLLAGIVLDTKHFSKNTGMRTFSAGYYLENEGANTQSVSFLFTDALEDLKSEARFETNVKIYKDVFAITTNYLSEGVIGSSSDRVAAAKAADKLLTVEGVAASFAVCPIDDTVHISARSSGKINVQIILEKLGGGGRFDSAATRLKGFSVNEALKTLKNSIDEYINETTHPDTEQ